MKNIKKLITLAAVSGIFIFTSCKKDDETKVQIKPLSAYLADSALQVSERTGSYELGYAFTSTKAGRITQVGTYMPEPGSYLVSIWDYDTKALLAQKTVEQNSAKTLVYVPITSLNIAINKKYVISLSCISKTYFFAYNKDYNPIFPFSSGDIVIIDSRYNGEKGLGDFPEAWIENSEIYGFPDFLFEEN